MASSPRTNCNNKRWFTGLDADKDGSVTLDEAVKGARQPAQTWSAAATGPTTSSPIQPANEDPSFKEAPQILKGSEHGVGRMVDDIVLKTLDGKDIKLSAVRQKRPRDRAVQRKTVRSAASWRRRPCVWKGSGRGRCESVAGERSSGPEEREIVKFVADHGLKAKVALDADGNSVAGRWPRRRPRRCFCSMRPARSSIAAL
jgi:hypothetical protein